MCTTLALFSLFGVILLLSNTGTTRRLFRVDKVYEEDEQWASDSSSSVYLPEHVRVVVLVGETATSRFDIAAAKLFSYVDQALLFNETRMVVTVLHLPPTENPLETSGYICAELKTASNLVGFVVAGLDRATSAYVGELARAWGVPIIDVSRDVAFEIVNLKATKRPSSNEPQFMVAKIHPSYNNIAQGVLDVVAAYKWKKMVFLYDSPSSLISMQTLLGDTLKNNNLRETIVLQVTEQNMFEVVRVALGVQKWATVVAAFDWITTLKFLKTALRCGSLSPGFTFVITNIDAHLFSMEEFAHNWPNVTFFRPIIDSGTTRKWLAAANHFETVQKEIRVLVSEEALGVNDRIVLPPTNMESNREFPIFLTSALIIDALTVFRESILKTLPEYFQDTEMETSELLSCSSPSVVMEGYGTFLFESIKNDSFNGITGPIHFNRKTLSRERILIDVLALTSKGLVKIGDWRSSVDGGNSHDHKSPSIFLWRPPNTLHDLLHRITVPPEDLLTLSRAIMGTSMKKNTLVVTTLLEKPYAMRRSEAKHSHSLAAGSSRVLNAHGLEGFCVDLIDEIASIIGFNYRLQLVGDGKYGKFDNATGKWNGLIGELIEQKADIAAAPLTITYAREEVVDFTKPFLHLGISILHVQPAAAPPSLFSFMDPLAGNVWLAISISYIVVTAVFYAVGRFSPHEYDYEDIDNPEKHPYTWTTSSWFVVGGFLGLGSELVPRAVSTRIVTVAWWFFSLIMISSYTANLAAFLTVEQHMSPFENVEDMARQTSILYGTLKGGATENFFKEAKIDTYQRMWSFMKDKDVFTKSNSEGIDRVRTSKGRYAYLMESVSLQYTIQNPATKDDCLLRQVGGLIDSKGYGLATTRQSPYRDLLSMAILQLQESDKLQILYQKWWTANNKPCKGDQKNKEADTMTLQNVLGIFLVLGFGFVTAVLTVTVEIFWNVRRPRVQSKAPKYSERLSNYLKMSAKTWRSKERPSDSRRSKLAPARSISSSSHLEAIIEEPNDYDERLEEIELDEIEFLIDDDAMFTPPKRTSSEADVPLHCATSLMRGRSDGALQEPRTVKTQTNFS